MTEIWKPIPGYENLYKVSNLGSVVNVASGKPLSLSVDSRGYLKVTLHSDGLRTFKVHRLVAICFVDNPQGYTEVNHINENKLDNRAENLERCSRRYNVNYGSRKDKQRAKVSKRVIQYNDHGNQIATFSSTVQAGKELSISRSGIAACCRGQRKTCGGYRWRYG